MEVSCPQGTGNSPWSESALCHAVSDADGKFTFNKIPCGKFLPIHIYRHFSL